MVTTHSPLNPSPPCPGPLKPSRPLMRQDFKAASLEVSGGLQLSSCHCPTGINRLQLHRCPPATQLLRVRMALQSARLLPPASHCLQLHHQRTRCPPSCSRSARQTTSKSSSTRIKKMPASPLTKIRTGFPETTACPRAWPPHLSKNAVREQARYAQVTSPPCPCHHPGRRRSLAPLPRLLMQTAPSMGRCLPLVVHSG